MQTIKLNLIPGSVLPVVNVSQYDVKRQFALAVYEGAVSYSLSGKSVEIRGTKPDGNGFAYDAQDGVVSVSGNTVTISTTQQMTAVGGQTMAELRIKSGTTILGTLNFILDVEHSALSDDTPISETEIPAIERDMQAAVDQAEAAAQTASTKAGEAATSATSAASSATSAAGSATTASSAATAAATKALEASTSATNAATSAGNASDSADAASGSARAASDSADDAADSADDSEAYANGTRGGSDVPSTDPSYHNNAKYWRDQAASYAAGGIHFMGSVPFSDIPTVGMANGDEYNITNDFVTDSRFVEGAGLACKAGTNIAWAMSAGKWDVLATGGGAETLGDLSDTSISSPADGQALVYNNTTHKWENRTVSTVGDLEDLGDVDLTTPTSGQVLKFDGSKWVNGNGGGGASDLDDLGDVTITTPTDGQVLTYDAASQKWVNANGGGGGGGFDYKDWLTAGDLNPMSYADLAAVLADEKAVRKLMTIHLAVDYLASQDLDADVLTILSDNLCAKWINLRDYAIDTLYGNQIFATQMDAIGKYGYGEWALMPQVPKMTSNTAPYGEASATNSGTATPAWKAFNDSESVGWNSGKTTYDNDRVQYHFASPMRISKIAVKFRDGSSRAITHTVKFVASNDGSTWVDISDNVVTGEINQYKYVDVNTTQTYSYIGMVDLNSPSGHNENAGDGFKLQFYAWAPKGNVPVMTSNTAPYGEVLRTSDDTGSPAWKALDGDDGTVGLMSATNLASNAESILGYHFTNPVNVKRVSFSTQIGSQYSNLGKIQYSDDGTTWTDATVEFNYMSANNPVIVEVPDCGYHLYWILRQTYCANGASKRGYYTLQFYGREMKVSVPVMTSNTAPYGQVIASSEASGYPAYNAFDNNVSTYWRPSAVVPCSVGYQSTDPICVKRVKITHHTTTQLGIREIEHGKIQGSNDGTNWVDISADFSAPADSTHGSSYYVDCGANNAYYSYHRVYASTARSSDNYVWIADVQFYGFDYSEYDWDTVNPRHYLYDHGVELETLEQMSAANGWSTAGKTANVNSQKLPYALYIAPTSSGYYDGFSVDHIIDLTSYNLMRFVADTNGSDGQNSNIFFSACSSKTNWETPNRIANIYFYGAPAGSLSLSGVNQSAYAVTNSINRSKGWGYVYEWWLE